MCLKCNILALRSVDFSQYLSSNSHPAFVATQQPPIPRKDCTKSARYICWVICVDSSVRTIRPPDSLETRQDPALSVCHIRCGVDGLTSKVELCIPSVQYVGVSYVNQRVVRRMNCYGEYHWTRSLLNVNGWQHHRVTHRSSYVHVATNCDCGCL